MTKALAVKGWKLAQPAREERPNGRVLRERKCNPPRLTTKRRENSNDPESK